MGRKTASAWTDFIGSSSLPADELTFPTGNNYGLDGFQFDTPYGEGVEESARLPESKGLSGLPDGIVTTAAPDLDARQLTEDDNGLDLASMLSEDEGGLGKNASVVDLEWLDPSQEPDPERLPNNEHTLDSLSQLEGAWGAYRTDGIHGVPNRDHHEARVRSPKTAGDIRDVMLRATRQAHYGMPFDDIQRNVAAELGDDIGRVRWAMKMLRSECGLLGKVFVRASAFPGLRNGKWVKELRRAARGARYVITEDATVADKLGMQMVDEVPWGDALTHYLPRLQAGGYKVAANGDPSVILRNAFLRGPEVAVPTTSPKPGVLPTVASETEARRALAHPVAHVDVVTPEKHAVEVKRRAALVQIAKWVKQGSLDHQDALRLYASNASHQTLLRTATGLMTASEKASEYEGAGYYALRNAQAARQAVWTSLEQQEKEVRDAVQARIASYLDHVVNAGLLTKIEAQRIRDLKKSPADTQRLIAAAVQLAKQHRVASLPVPDVREYVDNHYQMFVPERRTGTTEKQRIALAERIQRDKESKDLDRVIAARKAKPVVIQPTKKYGGTVYTENTVMSRRASAAAPEVRAMVKWARTQLTEGVAGHEFDQLIAARWSEPVRMAGSELIKKIRADHEGLSGHVYVDASVYASPSGVTGCERGGLKHRTNAIRYVLAMDRCASCTLAQTRANGQSVCSKYNKILASEPPVENPKAYQREMIRRANASDAENTATLFNPSEFSLQNEALEDIHFEDAPPVDKIGEVLFGGMEL